MFLGNIEKTHSKHAKRVSLLLLKITKMKKSLSIPRLNLTLCKQNTAVFVKACQPHLALRLKTALYGHHLEGIIQKTLLILSVWLIDTRDKSDRTGF